MKRGVHHATCGRLLMMLGLALTGVVPAPVWAQTSAGRGDRVAAVLREHPEEITPAVVKSIDAGLRYLAQSQNSDGSWRTRGASGGYPTAMTSLAGLALLSSGSTPTAGAYARNVSGAVTYLLGNARPDGLIASIDEEYHSMHGHGFAMLFLAQCYGMEENPARQAQIRSVLQRGVQLTERSQSAAGGWLYTPDSRSDEGSVTVTQVQALRACRNAGIAVPKRVIDRAMEYLVRSANPDGGIRYQAGRSGPSRAPITAAAVVCWYNAGIYDEPEVNAALEYVKQTLAPAAGRTTGHHYYAHFYKAQVMYLSGADTWEAYFRAMRRQLLQEQASDGSWMGDQVGQTYGTAIALLILQLPYKHLPIMQR